MTDDRDLDELLRQPVERLSAPEGTWDRIGRRARFRKGVKAGLGVAATVIVIAGALPAVIAVRHSSDDQTLAVGHFGQKRTDGSSAPRPSPSPVSNSALAGFFPESLSFVSPTVGYLWGSAGTSRQGIVAKTTDGGLRWTRLPAPPVNNAWLASRGADQIRFASGEIGFLYGSRNYVTTDGGQHWQPYAAPGYIADLEAMNQHIWALVRSCAQCSAVRLYSATASNPTLKRVPQVPVMHGRGTTPEVAGAASVALSENRVDVIVGGSSFYASPDGRRWQPRANPCRNGGVAAPVESALVSSSSAAGVVVACGYRVSGSGQTKRVFESANSGTHWTAVASNPHQLGTLQTLTAGSPSDILIGTSRGGIQVSHNDGLGWSTIRPGGVELSFVGFIATNHIVAVADRAASDTGSFATSYDGGKHWQVTRFPG